jgi:hypothetical protein
MRKFFRKVLHIFWSCDFEWDYPCYSGSGGINEDKCAKCGRSARHFVHQSTDHQYSLNYWDKDNCMICGRQH